MRIIIFFEKKLAILSNVIYNTFVVHGWIPEWPKGADCKSVGTAFEGSNPSPSSEFSSYIFAMWELFFCAKRKPQRGRKAAAPLHTPRAFFKEFLVVDEGRMLTCDCMLG